MTTYPGLPGPIICDYLSREASRSRYAPGVEFQIGKIEMVANTGTYLDSPFHRYADGKDLAQLPLESLADLDAVVVRIPPARPGASPGRRSRSVEVAGQGGAGADRLGRALAYRALPVGASVPHRRCGGVSGEPGRRAGRASIRSTSTTPRISTRPVHSTLLGAEVPIVEHMCNLARPSRARISVSLRCRPRSLASAPGRCGPLGMSFRQTSVSGFPAVALRSAQVEIVAVPAIGMKLTNLRRLNGREWLWRSDQIPLAPPEPGASYVETADSGGWDECFPTVGACPIPGAPPGTPPLPDHGELWSAPGPARSTKPRREPLSRARRRHSVPLRVSPRITLDPARAGGAIPLSRSATPATRRSPGSGRLTRC